MVSRYALTALVPILVLEVLAACSSVPPAPRQLLDEKTGVTMTVVASPMLFARVRNAASASGHDYVTLVTLENDNAGKYTELLLMYRWSISLPPPNKDGTGRLLIQADGHAIEMQPLERIPIDMSRSKDLFVPENVDVVTRAYPIDFETMRLIAMSHDLTVSLPDEPADAAFWLWRDGRPALAQLVKQLTGSQ
jgi:hypothetical protein